MRLRVAGNVLITALLMWGVSACGGSPDQTSQSVTRTGTVEALTHHTVANDLALFSVRVPCLSRAESSQGCVIPTLLGMM